MRAKTVATPTPTPACVQFREADGVGRAAGVGHLERGFLRADLGDGHAQVAVPVDGVEREVEVGIEDEHGESLRAGMGVYQPNALVARGNRGGSSTVAVS